MKKQPTNPYYHPEETQGRRRAAQSSSPYAQDTRQTGRSGASPRKKKKKKGGHRFLTTLLVLLLVCGGGYYALNHLVTGGAVSLPNLLNTPQEIRDDVVNILCAGIDYEEGRDYSDGMGMTDVVMYVSFDVKANRINMLQIPRDTYVGEEVPTGGTGKINAVARSGKQDPAIANLASVLNEQLKLPVDYYVTIDMDAFKTVINAIGGIEVTVPFDITDDYGNTLRAGTQIVDGATAEFMVRQRHNYANADLGRLEMQRYMYSALLKTFKSFPAKDIVKVMPAYIQYVKTDIGLAKMGGLALKVREVPSENITMFTLPCEPCNWNGKSLVSVHKEAAAEMLNTYFRPYSEPVPADQLTIIELANNGRDSGTVQSMDKIDSGTANWGKDSYTQPETPASSGAQ
ncbi:LCP family protein [Pygmaiobacter massiliensis]|uniref:LCP family protein n=1 Tax=Pygmaiobacter massiliensis TaxID=1917873 RepID=UPI002A7FD9B0|nr:LCP family protein [Pygmaiobacter massiliensis]MDY4783573.1 LCP family protein [Pygmaiobacter massiliensis]